MEKKTNVYLCVTEYHVLLSILLATEKYQTSEYVNRIILCDEGRFNREDRYDFTSVDNIEYKKKDVADVRSRAFIKDVLKWTTGTLFVFNMNNPHFLYICYKLKQKKQAKTSFVQEGLASYNYDHYSLKERLGRMRSDLSILYKAGVNEISFYFFCYGLKGHVGKIFDYYSEAVESQLVDDYWLTFPEESKFGRDKVIQLPSFTTKSLNIANGFFKYQQSVILRKNDIVYIDQQIEGSLEFIVELKQAFPQARIFVKPHPRTKQDWAQKYEKRSNVEVLLSLCGVPVELFLQNLNQVIVVTPFSSALLIDNPLCRFYYTYKWHLKHGYDIGDDNLYAPGKHIKIIETLGDIELF